MCNTVILQSRSNIYHKKDHIIAKKQNKQIGNLNNATTVYAIPYHTYTHLYFPLSTTMSTLEGKKDIKKLLAADCIQLTFYAT